MRIVSLATENFKRLSAVEITPEGNVVQITGKNGAGKSSVLDAIWVALKGRAVAPPQPIRKGAEKCTIRLDLGDLVVSRTFTAKEGGDYTDTLKVEDIEGRRYPRPQTVLDELLGAIGFDPFDFIQRKPDEQTAMLLELVALPIDLDELADQDERDFATRRDINRDAKALDARIGAIVVPAKLPERVDRAALTDKLSSAADHNAEIAHERQRRAQAHDATEAKNRQVVALREQAAKILDEANDLEKEVHAELAAEQKLKPLAEPIDTAAIREQLTEAEASEEYHRLADLRKQLTAEHKALVERSDALTAAMAERETQRTEALRSAQMPVEGLGIEVDGKHRRLTFGGVPFEQASTAEQLRVSTAIAMRANPELRVLRIKDGSLLDEDAMALLESMASTEDFQLWIERVGSGGVGILIENGAVAEPGEGAKAKPKAKAKDAPEGSLL